ncbi:MAG: hypothetical protein LC789_16730 [Actinobacteria bacterium]|nr:hypothetical protein [Actinomycetota bacterium]MCA1722032.1 hypothetical protein [Actinomycetota bacterium]
MIIRTLLSRTSRTQTLRAQQRAVERAMARAITPESRHELIVLEASRR